MSDFIIKVNEDPAGRAKGETIGDMLDAVMGASVTLDINGTEQKGVLIVAMTNGITIEEEETGRENLYYWPNVQGITIH